MCALCVISLVSPMFHATFLGGCLVRSVLAGWTGLTLFVCLFLLGCLFVLFVGWFSSSKKELFLVFFVSFCEFVFGKDTDVCKCILTNLNPFGQEKNIFCSDK